MKKILNLALLSMLTCLLMLTGTPLQAQKTYCHTPTDPENQRGHISFPRSGSAGPFHLKIYVHVIRKTDGTGGQSTTDVNNALAFLDTDFNPHQIFFEWDGCIDYIDNDSYYFSPSGAIFSVNNSTDGIDVYLYDDAVGGSGLANGVGVSSEFFVTGSYWDPPFGSLVKSHVMSHEMGHVLFLWHTHHSCETGNWENTNGSNCATAGDFVCDTPSDPHLGFNVPAATCVWSGVAACSTPEPIGNYTPDPALIMAYTHPDCMSYFTNGQGQRMRDAICNLPFLQDVQVNGPHHCPCTATDVHIYSNTTYSSDMGFGGNIIVHTGAQLTITATIQMAKNKAIVVERGAKLYLSGGTLTRCGFDDDWRGVVVEGNSSLPQPSNPYAMPASNQAGVVVVDNNATIEWARTAISTNYFGTWTSAKWGGLIYAENSTFSNNKRGAEFMKYNFTNKSKFVNCTFDGNSTINATTVGVTIWATNGVTFNRCRFYNMEAEGLLVYDAGAIVKDGNDFQHNRRGISSKATYPFAAYLEVGDLSSDPNYFLDNWFHIESYASNKLDGMKIINNEFFDSNTALWFVGPSKFFVENNSLDITVGGMVNFYTGSMNNNQHNYIRRNAISSSIGVVALGENRELQILCNQFSTNRDIRVAERNGVPGEIRQFQGNFGSGADNCFTNPGAVVDIETQNATVSFNYYVGGGSACKTPLNPGNYTVLSSAAAGCGDTDGFHDVYELDDLVSIVAEIDQIIASGGQPVETLVELLEKKEHILLVLVRDYLNDGAVDEAVRATEIDGSDMSQLMKYGIQVNAERYNDALSTLEEMPTSIGELAEFQSIQRINIDRLRYAGDYVLSDRDRSILEAFADTDAGVKAYARSILGLLEGTTYEEGLDDRGEVRAGEEEIEQQQLATLSESPVVVYPNPTTGFFTIAFNGEQSVKYLEVKSVLGKTIYQQVVPEQSTEVNISGANWQSGIYMLNLLDADGISVHTELLLMNK